MSAKKDIDTKVFEDVSSDSGYLSQPISEEHSSEDLGKKGKTTVRSDNKKVTSECLDLDSGLDLGVSEDLSNLKLEDTHPTEGTLIVIEDEKPSLLPPRIVQPEKGTLPPISSYFEQDGDGDTNLHIAAVQGNEMYVGTLIRVCPDKAWLDIPNDYGHTALHLAVMSGHAVITRMLVIAGSSITTRDCTGETPLHKAAIGNKNECIQALLTPVFENPPMKLSTILNQKNYRGQSCVHLAASSGNIDTLRTLVMYGADLNVKEGLAGWTPLHVAARRDDVLLVQFLLQQRGCSQNVQDYAGRTPRRVTRNLRVAALFAPGDDDDSDDDMYDSDSDSESLYDRIRQNINPINVA